MTHDRYGIAHLPPVTGDWDEVNRHLSRWADAVGLPAEGDAPLPQRPQSVAEIPIGGLFSVPMRWLGLEG